MAAVLVIVFLIMAALVYDIAAEKGYNGVIAVLVAVFTGVLPALIYYVGLPLTVEKELERRTELLKLVKKNNEKLDASDENYIDPETI